MRSITAGAFGRVVRRFNALDFDQRPQPLAVVVQFAAHPDEKFVPTEDTAQQQMIHVIANRLPIGLERFPRDRTRLIFVPKDKHDFHRSFQVETQSLRLVIVMINQQLEVSLARSVPSAIP